LSRTTDVVNLLVQRALDEGLRVSIIDAAPQLEALGGLAAVLRY